jgi:hypothetical protein
MLTIKSRASICTRHEWICLFVTLSFLLLSILFFPAVCRSQTNAWREAGEGLYVGELDATPKAESGDSKITVVKIDPRFYSFQLLCGSEHGRQRLTVKDWCGKFNLVAAVNAGMFQEDGFRSVGYMKNFDHVINSRVSRENTILAFNRLEPDVPEIQIIDRECQDFDNLKRKYASMVQSIRMISCDQENVWSQQPTKWSTVAIATDEEGKVLLLFSRSPYSVHDFIEILLSLPLSIHSAMYLEGGPQASMYLSTEKVQIERYGIWEPVLEEGSALQFALPIPNVIGIVKKPQ